MIINEGQKVIIYNLSHDSHSGLITVNSTFELKENTLVMDNDYLCCVESVELNKNGLIIAKVYEQDAVVIKGDYIYKSMSDAY
jgi:hypothetical protein